MNITLFENHWYDATFGSSARLGGDDEGEESEGVAMTPPEVEERHEASSARRVAVVGVVPMLVASIAVGVVAARRIRDRRAAHAEELRQVEVDAIEYANDIAE